ncbi:hypothetical protein CUMW_272750 [Citrus unshiu]|uniref:Uncharacterized protein n=1 Tax=Citrus unshiu TaxID=55188 RepID=A0A2H5MV56_CITUN|nr:hypothetical protein CUMW_272750 [Citrus unshiu]
MGLSLRFFTFMHLVSSLLIFHLAIAHFTSSMQPHTLCHDQDRSALLKFIESLTINRNASRNPLSYPKVASWNQDEQNSDCCSWDGIKCDEDTGHVIGLNLSSSWLYGSINSSSSLFQLVHLEWLALADNHFNFSVIPSEIVNLSRLTRLSLSGSFFAGQIPAELLELSRLEVLDLSSNDHHLKLQSPVPPTLANFKSSLHGEIPTEIFQLPNLRLLELAYNSNLTGHLSEFQKNNSLELLNVAYSGFSGKIPNSIENLKSLSHLYLPRCYFSGKIPPSLGNLTKLAHLFLWGNGFSGELPTSIGNLASLEILAISSCNFSGAVPASSLRNLTQLTALIIGKNNFSSLSSRSLSWIADLKKLTILDLESSKIVGEVPPALMNLTQLTQLSLAFNHQLTANQLEGSIPSSFFELKNLVELELAGNKLSGTLDINKFLLNMKSLEVLVLSSNKLSLLTEATVNTYSKNINVIGLRSCNLTEFPHFLYNQKFLDSVDLSSNRIAGQVPGWFLNNVLVHVMTTQPLKLPKTSGHSMPL